MCILWLLMSLDIILPFDINEKTISMIFAVPKTINVLSKSHINIKSFFDFGFLETISINVRTLNVPTQ